MATQTHIHIQKAASRLRVEDGVFVVEQSGAMSPFAPSNIAALYLYPGISISSDALLLAVEHEADVVLLGRDGHVHGRIWSHKYGSISTLRRKQLDFTSGAEGFAWIAGILKRKFRNQLLVLEILHFDRPVRFVERIRTMMEGQCSQVDALKYGDANFKSQLRLMEAAVGKLYWKVVSMGLPQQYQFKSRSRRPALDPFNAMLNYAYGILYACCEKSLIMAGLDPYLGVFHADMHNRPVLVYDFIEPYRQWADYTIIKLCTEQAIGPECLEIDSLGGCLLNPYGARIVAQCVHDYLNEVISIEQVSRSRLHHIEYDAMKLASSIANLKIK